MKYIDKNGKEIKADDIIHCTSDNSYELVVSILDADGSPDLAINASNIDYLKAHGGPMSFYSLYQFDLEKEWEVVGTKADSFHLLTKRQQDLINGNF